MIPFEPATLPFKPVTLEDAPLLRRYYESCDYELCEYSLGTKLMWQDLFHPHWAEAAGCLVAFVDYGGEIFYEYPVVGVEGDEDAALLAIEGDSVARNIPFRLTVVPEAKAARLLRRYPYVKVSNIRTYRDYLYRTENLQTFAGRHYSGQRNHIKKFHSLYPDAVFRRLTEADFPAVELFWTDYEAEFTKGDDAEALKELSASKEMLKLLNKPWFLTGGMFDGEKLIALSMAERCGETLMIHSEKALYSYPGVYPTLVQEFANAFGEGVRLLNREDDAGDRGLRTSKLQYEPVRVANKYNFKPQNELQHYVDEIPTLSTPRLTLSALEERDIPQYNALILDKERNKGWGYDDVGGTFEAAERGFRNRTVINFAVRLDGQLIGGAVLFNFDYQGGAELGFRIAPAYGYASEVLTAVADWGLYRIHLNRVWARCGKENHTAYQELLASGMRHAGEDDTFHYFERMA